MYNDQQHHGQRFVDVERLRSPERVQRLEVERVVTLVSANPAIQTVIDIGTGSGLFAEGFAKRGLTVSGIDVNPEMLEAARTFVPDADFRLGPAENIPFADNSFDLVFLGLVFHETDDLSKVMSEAFRIARQQMAVLEWPYQEQDFGPGLEERLRPEQMMRLAAQAGFINGEVIQLKHLVLYRFTKPELEQ